MVRVMLRVMVRVRVRVILRVRVRDSLLVGPAVDDGADLGHGAVVGIPLLTRLLQRSTDWGGG